MVKNKFFKMFALAAAVLLPGGLCVGSDASAAAQLADKKDIKAIASPEVKTGDLELQTFEAGKTARVAHIPVHASRPGRPSKTLENSIMLQGFHWESHQTAPWWNIIARFAPEIGKAGFDMVWLPPSGQAASDEGYIPVQLFNQNSLYGTETQLRNAIAALHANNVLAIGDMVINHRVGSRNWADFTNPAWGPDSVCSDDEWPGAKGGKDSGDGFSAARYIDHSKEYVRWMRDYIGYDGWRYDYTKGYSGQFIAYYNDATQPVFSVGELWTDLDYNNINANRQRICDWIDSTGGRATAFDFTTKALLQYVAASGEYWRLRDAQGKPAGLLGWWPANSVTFIDNHDTGPSPGGGQNHWPFPAQNVMQGYAYILTHPGIPCVYWVHYFDWGLKTEINNLMRLRRARGITATSPVQILIAQNGLYAAMINNNTIMKIGHANWAPAAGWKLTLSGKDYAVWIK